MTWTLKLRGAPHPTTIAEYECPDHGRFSIEVQRDKNGEPPAAIYCTVVHWTREPEPPCCPSDAPCEWHGVDCGLSSPWRISAPISRVKMGDVVQGRDNGPAAPDRNLMNTRPLADGTMTMAEFKAHRAKVHADISLERVRKLRTR